MAEFVRRRNYPKEIVADVQTLLRASRDLKKPIMAIPHENSIICYRGCMPFATIYEDRWIRFSDSYKKRFPEGYSFQEINKDYKSFLLNPEDTWRHLSDVLDAVWKGMPTDVEKHTQHIIACNHQSFDDNTYSVCGVETCIPSDFMSNGHKPEIDFVAFCPKRKEMLLIEYKCKYSSLYPSKGAGIREHWIDYTRILRNAEKIRIIPEMLNAYNLLCEIENKTPCMVDPAGITLRVAFLLTGDNYKDDNKGCITEKANQSAREQVLRVKEVAKGDLITEAERQNLLWGWQKSYSKVNFNTCFESAMKAL